MNFASTIIVIVLLFALILSGGCTTFDEKRHPADDVLIENFRAHRGEFEELRQLFMADRNLTRVAFDFTRPENAQSAGVSRDRLNEYRNLFNKLGLKNGIEGYGEKDTIFFHSSSIGLAVTGSGKGYVFVKIFPKRSSIIWTIIGYRTAARLSPSGRSKATGIRITKTDLRNPESRISNFKA